MSHMILAGIAEIRAAVPGANVSYDSMVGRYTAELPEGGVILAGTPEQIAGTHQRLRRLQRIAGPAEALATAAGEVLADSANPSTILATLTTPHAALVAALEP